MYLQHTHYAGSYSKSTINTVRASKEIVSVFLMLTLGKCLRVGYDMKKVGFSSKSDYAWNLSYDITWKKIYSFLQLMQSECYQKGIQVFLAINSLKRFFSMNSLSRDCSNKVLLFPHKLFCGKFVQQVSGNYQVIIWDRIFF